LSHSFLIHQPTPPQYQSHWLVLWFVVGALPTSLALHVDMSVSSGVADSDRVAISIVGEGGGGCVAASVSSGGSTVVSTSSSTTTRSAFGGITNDVTLLSKLQQHQQQYQAHHSHFASPPHSSLCNTSHQITTTTNNYDDYDYDDDNNNNNSGGRGSSSSNSNNNSGRGNNNNSSSSSACLVKLNVGGRRYITTRSTIFSRGENFLTALLLNDDSSRVNVARDDDGYIFIDRNGEAFSVVLDFLRTGTLILKHSSCSAEQLVLEFDFYQIDIPYERSSISGTKLYRCSNAVQWKEEARKWVSDNVSFIEEIMVVVTNQGTFECSLHLTTTTEHLHRISVLSAPDDVIQLTGPGTRCTSPLPTHLTYNCRNRVWWMFVQQFVDKIFSGSLHLVFHDTPPSLYLNWENAFPNFA
jgi:hypothetical protein